ncbi:MAG: type II toxin-antitoxin system VapC family toxin [Alphaproteobacteria bacterium]
MRILLDTNVLLWALAGSPRIRQVSGLILGADTEVYVSTASWWEVAVKASAGKIDADVQVLRAAAADSGFLELPVYGVHVEALARLPMLHHDPFDRMIVAQAMAEPMRLLTGDGQLAAYTDLVQKI